MTRKKVEQAKPSLQEQADADQAAHHDVMQSGGAGMSREDIVQIAKPSLDEFIGDDTYARWFPLVERISIDPTTIEATYAELEAALDSTAKVGHQSFELERAETNARKAFSLYLMAKSDRAIWEIENTRSMSALRQEASDKLQAEKEAKTRTKRITEADVTAMIQDLFSDEFLRSETKRVHFDTVEKTLEHLARVWGDKTRSLQVLVSRGR